MFRFRRALIEVVAAGDAARTLFSAATALATPGERILHVGDDWWADVVGAKQAGWLAAYLRGQQGDSPLPSSAPDDSVRADLVIDRLGDLPAALTG